MAKSVRTKTMNPPLDLDYGWTSNTPALEPAVDMIFLPKIDDARQGSSDELPDNNWDISALKHDLAYLNRCFAS
ncbi:hypothetical protein AVEN_275581-1 [Araneus ventricosus]|uniref:Uncharacterized protein n=1 Tax=Araneus ventricosus TaxID=182803 RepID=A0A4Y2Q9P4_ARAVE|nr:hypothetical protein AVEN_275581-1 [Araneus ventricosus]